MTFADVYDLRWRVAGMSYQVAADLCGVTTRTIRRWEKAGRCPVWFLTLCRAYGGRLDALRDSGDGWRGWRLVAGALVSPEGITYTPYEVNSIPWLWAMVNDLRTTLQRETAPGTQKVLPFPEALTRSR
jgi:hypothetical protein